jgi:hypothetical protein
MEESSFESPASGPQPGPAPRYAPRYSERDKNQIAHYTQQNDDTFAGVWIEPDGSFVVAFTRDVQEHLAAMRSLLDAPDRVTAVRFRYTYRHLVDLTHNIVAILGTSEGLSNWGTDVRANKVCVEALPERIAEVRRILGETNPDDVYVELGSPVRKL